MERYVEQLIDDLRRARHHVEPSENFWENSDPENFDIEQHFKEVEKYVNQEGEKPIAQIVGIEKEKLPSVTILTVDQAKALAEEMEKLWKYYNFYPTFPDNVPGDIKYRLLRDMWDSKQVYLKGGMVGIEFCDYDESNCPFPDHCNSCKEWKNDFENIENSIKMEDLKSDSSLSGENDKESSFRKKVEKAKELMENMPINEDYITGIYNYCDRWCERCAFTTRCLNYALEEEMYGSGAETDISNKEFWDSLSVLFTATSELLFEKAEEFGIDLNDIEESEDIDHTKNIKDHPLWKLSYDYSYTVSDWIKNNTNGFIELTKQAVLMEEEKVIKLNDALEVIQWYNFFIHVKINRALDSSMDFETDPEMAEWQANETNGTAKVALIAVDRSIGAFGYLLERMKSHEDDILRFLSVLGKIRIQAENIFPEARNFVRPGFDE